jgi:rhodanese-related sulfurtransferase
MDGDFMFSKLFSKAVDSISPDEAMRLMENQEGVLLLDVRTPQEYSSMHIPRSVNVPLDQINRIDQLVQNKDTTIIVYCLSGARASSAARFLRNMGYTDVSNLGGISAWPYKTVKGNA